MNVFIIHSGKDIERVKEDYVNKLKNTDGLFPLVLEDYKNKSPLNFKEIMKNMFWKVIAWNKIKKANVVVFVIGETSGESKNIKWEIKKAKKLEKVLYSIKINPNYPIHPALMEKNKYTGEENRYDKEVVTTEELIELIKEPGCEIINKPLKDKDIPTLLEQYKTYLETSESLSSRRQTFNNFYYTMNAAIVFASGVAFSYNSQDVLAKYRFFAIAVFSLLGLVLSFSWSGLLTSYGIVNSSKMKIIISLEKSLPASLFLPEWEEMSDKFRIEKYRSFTDSEKKIPKGFIILYSLILIATIIYTIVNHANLFLK